MQQVLFVCEHGAAKSILAASYFNALARQQGLPLQASARGTAPDPAVLPAVAEGLAAERIPLCEAVPQALQPADLAAASLVVSFDQPAVVAAAGGTAQAVAWDGLPPVSADYPRARAAILERVHALIQGLGT